MPALVAAPVTPAREAGHVKVFCGFTEHQDWTIANCEQCLTEHSCWHAAMVQAANIKLTVPKESATAIGGLKYAPSNYALPVRCKLFKLNAPKKDK